MLIKTYKKIIDENLRKYLKPSYPQILFESMAYTTLLDGKRLRPILVLESCRIFSGHYEIAIPTACALEMLHAQSLIFDDLPCMDNDEIRRHKPSNHVVFGEATALMAGDALITHAPLIIIENTKAKTDIVLKIIKEYCKAAGAYGIVGGQVVDIISENKKIDNKTLNYIHKHKTGALFEFAVKAGSILGGASEKQLNKMEKFGEIFGKAFQIYDDILDEISNTDELGKTAGKDKTSGKSTYVSLYGLEKAKKDLAFLLNEAYAILDYANVKSDVIYEILASVKDKIKLY